MLLSDEGPVVAPDGDQAYPVGVTVAGKQLAADAAGFFQASVPGLEAALPLMQEFLGSPEQLVDLYGGIGLIPALIAPGASLTLVEARTASARMAEENCRDASVAALSVDEWLELRGGLPRGNYTISVDPPRAGLTRRLKRNLCLDARNPLLYLSCDAKSLARDTVELCAAGYRISRAALLDFYPQTPRVEVLCRFEPPV